MSSAHNAGHKVRALTIERPTAVAMVMPNCVSKTPAVPPMKVTGMNTAMNTSVQETTAIVPSLMASRVAR